jgi:hypothetical protein
VSCPAKTSPVTSKVFEAQSLTHLSLFFAHDVQVCYGTAVEHRSRLGVCWINLVFWSSTSRITTWPTKIFTLHWINNIILNNKCIFTQLNAVFNTRNGCMNKIILLQLIPSQNTRLIQQTPIPFALFSFFYMSRRVQ